MRSLAPTAEQRLLATAVGRVLIRHTKRWNRERSGDLRADLGALLRSVREMVGRGAPQGDSNRGDRKFWGWGYEHDGPHPLLVEAFLEYLKERFGLGRFVDIPAPLIEDVELRPPRFELPEKLAAFCRSDQLIRASHSYGKAFRDIVRALHRQLDNPPDYVAFPATEAQLEALLRFGEAEEVALVIYGGGSSVTGGVNPTRSSRYRGVITVDMARFDRLLEVDEISRIARVQSGLYGPALEAALEPYGLSTRFYPQSFEFSTVGGWIATRAAGHYCTLYTHIDEIVQAVRVVTPAGPHETPRVPACGAGIGQQHLWLGSEGTLGVITEAWLRLHARPRFRSSSTVQFATFEAGVEAVRALAQSKLYPVNCRLVDALESAAMGVGDGRHAMLLLLFESEHFEQRESMRRALSMCRNHGGKPRRPKHTESRTGPRTSAAGSWRSNFLKAPYLRDILATRGLVIETLETVVTWEHFDRLHREILQAAQRAFDAHCEGRGLVTCRFTHVYPDGPAPYYSVVAWAPPGKQLETWDAIKAGVSDAIVEFGGAITHHHAVGRDHRPWYERERGAIFNEALRALKSTLDPERILNPGVLISEP